MKYLRSYPRLALGATLALIVATAAQLAVPQLVQRIIDSIVSAATNQAILNLPANIQTLAAEKLGLDLTVAQTDLDGARQAIIFSGLLIVAFAVARGVFAFAQTYMSQVLSESIAFDLRNDIFSKIQRLSFSYHDRNRTGQLMVRATDDVERLRVFIGQGLLMALQALILLVGTLIILLLTNWKPTLVVLPVLPVALIVFMIFGAKAQPLFREVQQRLGRANTILQENSCRPKGGEIVYQRRP
ncbi:MAG: ABC transporter transmembrane domain-containing protein [Chloroflexota bacterium]